MKKSTCSGKTGSILVLTVVLLTVSCIFIGAIAIVSETNSRNTRTVVTRDQEVYLLDAGLRCAMNQMADNRSGSISKEASREFFADKSMFGNGDWGFSTAVYNVNGSTNRLVSFDVVDGITNTVEVGCISLVTNTIPLHFIYKLIVYSGKLGGLFKVGGVGSSADFVNGDVYVRGNIEVTGEARLRYGELDKNNNGLYEPNETWKEAYAVTPLGPMTQAQFNTYSNSVKQYAKLFYNNGKYDAGEAFVDNIGNGRYDVGEPFTDVNGDGKYTPGYTKNTPGNGVWDVGEAWTEDTTRTGRNNGVYDPAGGYYANGVWKTSYTTGSGKKKQTISCADWPAESFADEGYSTDIPPEPYVDQNGVYDIGEQYLDDRNGVFDWGTMASGTISGMGYVDPALGIRNAVGGSPIVEPPDLGSMYYNVPRTNTAPANAAKEWGNDVMVTASDYGTNGYAILTTASPEHIFIRNPETNVNKTVSGVTIQSREYDKIYYTNSVGVKTRIDDYFLEDPTDSTYNNPDSSGQIGKAGSKTYPMYLNVTSTGNEKVYYVDGNLYIHSPVAYSLRFKTPGTKIVIVVKGNITISDEFYYNAEYNPNLTYSAINSTVVKNPKDLLCLIALKNPNVPGNSGNIKIGDKQFGTGGSIHAMLYAENDFVDNNLSSSGQAYISIYGNMCAGGEVALHRDVGAWTRLDVSMDTRLSQGELTVRGLPPAPAGTVFLGSINKNKWLIIPGTWKSSSMMSQ